VMCVTLRRLREQAGLSQNEMADALGCLTKTYSLYENQPVAPPEPVLERLLDYWPETAELVARVRATVSKRRSFSPHTSGAQTRALADQQRRKHKLSAAVRRQRYRAGERA
jgi:transcriptional regulator with XRE-family HTH domain